MKNSILFLLFLLLCVPAFGQVDTLWIGTPQTDPLNDTLIDCYQYGCAPDSSHSYFCPAAYNGVLDIFGSDGIVYEILIVLEHQFVVIDTCVTLWSFAGGQLNLPYAYPSGFDVIVNGPEGAWVSIESKVDLVQAYDSLPPTITDLATICASWITDPAMEARNARFYDLHTLTETAPSEFKPEHFYLRRGR